MNMDVADCKVPYTEVTTTPLQTVGRCWGKRPEVPSGLRTEQVL